ncbi:MAG: amidohydrolase [Lachnospiraceae bacterium]|nr:amidohydrolase [Lachnospiraceae bacterium]MBR2752443.1 amidohydrolase [Lachnospiraceae bacterium]
MNTRIYNARILTLDGETDVIQGEICIEGDTITYVGSGEDAPQALLWDCEIDAENNLILPGFKNAHTHSAMTFLRSFADDLPLLEWLNTRVFPMEAHLKPEHILWFSKLAIMEYLTSGITANFDMYFFPEQIAQASIETGFRTVMVSGLNNYGGSVEELEENYLKFNDYHDLISYQLGIHAEYTCSDDLMKSVAQLAYKHSAPVYMHLAETEQEVRECQERHDGLGPVKYFDSIGMFDYGGGGFHCVHLDEEDIEIFKAHDLYAVTNPASNLKLASGICHTADLLAADIPMAIGTDGPASNNCLDFFREMFLVTGLGKIREMDAAAVPAEAVLKMAAADGARAMGLHDCDCLAPGKKADLIMIDMKQPNMQPEHNIVKNLVYSGSKQNVKMTMVGGKVLYKDGKFDIGIDPEEVYAKANEMVRRDF